ncbi:hypothetical protein BH24CHL8_BH24CHL8_11170 [soil metagenome]
MEGGPCPLCETERDPASGICPVCQYDPALADEPVAQAEPDIPYLVKYGGTHYAEASARPQRPFITLGRTRVLVIVALLAVLALYASLMMISDRNPGSGRPVLPPGLVLTR